MGLICQYERSRHYSGKVYDHILEEDILPISNLFKRTSCQYRRISLNYSSGPARVARATMFSPRGCQEDTNASSGKQNKRVISSGSKKMPGGSELGAHIASSSKLFFINA